MALSPKSLSFRLLAWFCILLCLVLGIPFFLSLRAMTQEILAEGQTRAKADLETVAYILRGHGAFASAQSLDEACKAVGQTLGFRVTYIVGGSVVADSQVAWPDLSQLDDHAARPEVLEAKEGRLGLQTRFSSTLMRPLIYAARAESGLSGVAPGILRVAVPFSEVHDRVERLRGHFYLIFALVLLGAAGLSLLLARRLKATISAFSEAALAVGRGEYDRRLRITPGEEFQGLAQAVSAMAEHIQDHVRTIEEQKSRLAAIFNGLWEGVAVLDAEGRILDANRAATALFPELEGGRGKKILEATLSPEIHRSVERMLASTALSQRLNFEIERQGGGVVEVGIVPFLDERNRRRLIVVFNDVTEVRRLERLRRDFVANVSHELKTPLTSIKGYAETIGDMENLPPQVGAFAGTIVKNADHMTKMVGDLLTLARIEHSGGGLRRGRVPLAQALAPSLEALTPIAAAKGVTLRDDLSGVQLTALGDADGLAQAFQALLENAVRHSPAQGVVSVAGSSDEGVITVCVTDQGPGVPLKVRERIFERFYRHDPAPGDKSGSAGLGLAICRHIIANHGGDVWVESAPEGSGSRFCFTLPDAHQPQQGQPDGTASA